MRTALDEVTRQRLLGTERALVDRAGDLAVFLAYDRPKLVEERPGLERAFFAQRCVSDHQLAQTIDAFRSIGAYVELFEGEKPFLAALTEGRLQALDRTLRVVYNGIEGGSVPDGFEPGRKALIPTIADSYGMVCSTANAYVCALGRHKFHYLTLLRALGVRTTPAWQYHPLTGWTAGRHPEPGTKVIVKSTYESWSVGVTEESIFVVDDNCEQRVAAIAAEIGQPVTVHEFVRGTEVCVPVFCCPDPVVGPPVEVIVDRAPGDGDAVVTIHDGLRQGGVTYRRFEAASTAMDRLYARAVEVFTLVGLESFGRIDFRVDESGEMWLTDVAVNAGLSDESSGFRSVSELGLDHPSYLRLVIATALAPRGLLA
jgi:D-alanine-D-alanine ligase